MHLWNFWWSNSLDPIRLYFLCILFLWYISLITLFSLIIFLNFIFLIIFFCSFYFFLHLFCLKIVIQRFLFGLLFWVISIFLDINGKWWTLLFIKMLFNFLSHLSLFWDFFKRLLDHILHSGMTTNTFSCCILSTLVVFMTRNFLLHLRLGMKFMRLDWFSYS